MGIQVNWDEKIQIIIKGKDEKIQIIIIRKTK